MFGDSPSDGKNLFRNECVKDDETFKRDDCPWRRALEWERSDSMFKCIAKRELIHTIDEIKVGNTLEI